MKVFKKQTQKEIDEINKKNNEALKKANKEIKQMLDGKKR